MITMTDPEIPPMPPWPTTPSPWPDPDPYPGGPGPRIGPSELGAPCVSQTIRDLLAEPSYVDTVHELRHPKPVDGCIWCSGGAS